MILVLRQFFTTLAVFVGLYAVAFAVTLAFFPLAEDREASLYSYKAYRDFGNLYRSEQKYVVLNRAALAASDPSLIVIGFSQFSQALAPAALEQRLGDGRRIHNLSIGGGNVRQIAQTVELVREIAAPETLCASTFVLGIWYGAFIDDARRWAAGPTDIDVERLRYGLYRRTVGGIEPTMPPRWTLHAATLLRPFLALEVATKGSLKPLRRWIERGSFTEPDFDTAQMDEVARARTLDYWQRLVGAPEGRLVDEQFELLARTAETLAACGTRVVIVDNPIPAWHRAGSPYTQDYRDRLTQHLKPLLSKGGRVSFHDLTAAFPDTEFYDDVHPRTRARSAWVDAVASTLDGDASERKIASRPAK